MSWRYAFLQPTPHDLSTAIFVLSLSLCVNYSSLGLFATTTATLESILWDTYLWDEFFLSWGMVSNNDHREALGRQSSWYLNFWFYVVAKKNCLGIVCSSCSHLRRDLLCWSWVMCPFFDGAHHFYLTFPPLCAGLEVCHEWWSGVSRAAMQGAVNWEKNLERTVFGYGFDFLPLFAIQVCRYFYSSVGIWYSGLGVRVGSVWLRD